MLQSTAPIATYVPSRRTPALGGEFKNIAMLIGIAAVAGIFVVAGLPEIAAPAVFVLFVMTVAKPQIGAYLFLLSNPLIVGMERGAIIPFMRPNEGLLLFVLGAVTLHLFFELLSGRPKRMNIGMVEVTFVILVAIGSVYPLLLQLAFDGNVPVDGILYSFVLVKYLLLYAFFKKAIQTQYQIFACLIVAMFTSVIVAMIGFLQVGNLFGVPEMLNTYYGNPWAVDLGVTTDRATSTIASSFGVADTMTMNMLIALALLLFYPRSKLVLMAAAIVFLGGCVTAGSFSGIIGLFVAVMAFGFITGYMNRIIMFGAPLVLAVGAMASQIIANRLSGFDRPSGLPQSWEGRLNNLDQFFLPELLSGFNWLLGVQPLPRVVAPETWRDFVYIESGYIWLLWIGGVPFLFAFLAFIWASLKKLKVHALAREASPQKVAAIACMSYIYALMALMVFDPHFTARGAADLFFPILAIGLVTAAHRDAAHYHAVPNVGQRLRDSHPGADKAA